MVAAQRASHMTSAMGQTFSGPAIRVVPFAITQPVDQIVVGLNDFQPVTILGYPSALAILAAEAREGRLRVSPKRIISTSEPLLPHVRQAVEATFQVPMPTCTGPPRPGPWRLDAGAAPACTSATTW
jgi:phenylacetate-CoA ligase